MEFPENVQENMELFRQRVAAYRCGDKYSVMEMDPIILTHAGTCDVGELFVELPPNLQDYILKRSLDALVPRGQMFTVVSSVRSSLPPRPVPVDPEVAAARKRESERQDELHYQGLCRFYDFFKKTGKIQS